MILSLLILEIANQDKMPSVIIVFTNRLNIGLTAIPYHAKFQDGQQIELLEHVTPDHIREHPEDYSDEEKEMIKLLHTISDKELFRKFSRENSLRDFINNIPSNILEERIRPEIEKKMYQLVRMLAVSRVPVYFKQSGYSNVYRNDRLKIAPTPCQPLFYVNVNGDHMTYSLKFRQNGYPFSLAKKDVEVICSSPAVLKTGNKLYYFEKFESGKLKPFKEKEYLHIKGTKAIETYLSKFIIHIVEQYHIEGTGFEVVDVSEHPEVKLILEKDIFLRPVLRFKFRYGSRWIVPNQKSSVFVDFINDQGKYIFRRFQRNSETEERFFTLLKDNGLQLVDDISFAHLDDLSDNKEQLSGSINPANLVEWVREHRQLLIENNVQLELKFEGEEYSLEPVNIYFDTASDELDWFDINSIVEIPPHKIPFTKFRRNILNGDRRFVLPDGTIFIIPKAWFTKYYDLINFGKTEGDRILLPKSYYHLLDELQKSGRDDLEEVSTPELPKLKEFNSIPLPQGLNATLRPYQVEGYQWLLFLRHNRFGGILADDMGLGKTLQTIALLQKIYSSSETQNEDAPTGQLSLFSSNLQGFNRSGIAPSLIVMPTSLVHNWKNELKRFAPSLKCYIYTGSDRLRSKDLWKILRHYHVVITTYGILRNDIEILENTKWEYLILDESQSVKNPSSKGYNAVKQIRANHYLALTGTPIENSLVDLWAQMNIVNEGLLKSLNFFKKYYEIPISRNEDEAKSEHLQKMISPFLLRRTKEMVAQDLPPIMEQVVYCDMTTEQKEIYEREKSGVRNKILEAIESRPSGEQAFIALKALTRLRQLANHPSMLFEEYQGGSGKFEQMLESLENILSENHNVLIFSSFVKDLELLEKELVRRQIGFAKLIGKTQQRDQVEKAFKQNDNVKVFLISLKAGGVGLNLIKADYVFMLNPWWNPKAEAQAINRAHRIGQTKNVFVYRFISSETIEEKIAQLQEKKNRLADTFVNTSNPLTQMNSEQIKELFN
ncbi:Helicase conserved C-terminal domain-containing protein [Thermophagus xiamenensis]|uniref:Helicase conserved C-terminal domain-containing protein n=2 Tax=Thermophagus xiamenensis TaxID=385682 RepID=A0A1I2BWV6_9BACT|nr:Helicase conserved C-terminal domain-containing protein [Thermophagus xiamenensis]